MDELLGSLVIYELSWNQSTEEKDSRKKRILAFKAAKESKDDTGCSDSQKEDKLALITREFKKVHKRREKLRRRKLLNKVDPSKEKEKEEDQ